MFKLWLIIGFPIFFTSTCVAMLIDLWCPVTHLTLFIILRLFIHFRLHYRAAGCTAVDPHKSRDVVTWCGIKHGVKPNTILIIPWELSLDVVASCPCQSLDVASRRTRQVPPPEVRGAVCSQSLICTMFKRFASQGANFTGCLPVVL